MQNTCFHPRPVAAYTVIVTLFCGGAGTADLIPTYGALIRGPSVPLAYANGASPYSGVGRYDGVERCTAFFLETAGSFIDLSNPSLESADAPAYAVTEGRCAADLAGDGVLIDGPGAGRVLFNYFADRDARQVAVPVARTAFATVNGRNLALLELAAPYSGLVAQSIRPLPVVSSPRMVAGDPVAVVGAPLGRDHTEDFLRLAFCRIDGIAPELLEGRWLWFDTPFNRCRDVRSGSSGSPVLSLIARAVVGLISTTTAGGDDRAKCAVGHPCEPTDGPPRSRRDTHYVSSVATIGQCFNARGRFDINERDCSLATELRDDSSSVRLERPRS